MYYIISEHKNNETKRCICYLKTEFEIYNAGGLYFISEPVAKNKKECKRLYPDFDIVQYKNLKKYFNKEFYENTKKLKFSDVFF